MRNVLFAIVVVVVAIASTTCGARIGDATRNVRGVEGVDVILYQPNRQMVVRNGDFFVVCSKNGIVGVLNPISPT